MSVQQFCLRWNNHQPNFISVFSSLLHNEALVDVTLAAEGRHLQAHKVVLSACSSYFQSLFTSNPCQHPIVILKDVQYNDLKTMVDFMYYGEVNVSQEQLPHILKTAEMLKIKGLAEMPDPVTLTKSENKSSDQTDSVAPNSVNESMWGSSESQQQYHQQQQPQHQQRRSPSPGTMSPSAARRKRLRKSSTGSGSASTERTSEEHSSIEGSSGLNMSQSQMDQMTAFGPAPTNLSSQHNLSNPKMMKESLSTEDIPQHDSSQESIEEVHHGHHHIHQNIIKTDNDMSGMSQQMPIDITSPTTPSDHGSNVSCPQSQPSHSGVQWTVVDSNYPRFALSSCQTNVGGMSSGGNHNNPNESQHSTSNTSANSATSSNHAQMHYQGPSYSPQIISVNPNSLVNNYSSSLSTPTSPQGNNSNMVQSVYSEGPTPNQSPVQQHQQQQQQQQQQMVNSNQTGNASGSSTSGTQPAPQKRKRSVNPQGDENFVRALEAVRFGGIGFCKAARMYGVNNRTLWLEYKKRGYPISRPSIKNRIKLEPNMTPPPSSTPTNEENTSMETYEHMSQSSLNMTVPPPADTPTSLMCPPHAHPMGVMSFLDTRHVEFTPTIHPMSRQRFAEGAVNVNPTAMNLQGLNFNSM